MKMDFEKPDVIHLFPTVHSLRQAELRGLKEVRFRRNFFTFRQFETLLMRDLPKNWPTVSETERYLLVIKLIKDGLKKQAGYFPSLKSLQGFPEVLLRFFDDLKQSLLQKEDLKKISGYAGGKEKELFSFFEKYCDYLTSNHLFDPGDLQNELIDGLGRDLHRFSLLRGIRKIVFNQIYDFTPYRFEMVYRIGQKIPIELLFPIPDNRKKAFGFIERNLAKFEALADREGLIEIRFIEPMDPVPSGIRHLRSNVFISPCSDKLPSEGLQDVRILQCSSRYREIEEIGKEIKILEKKGTPLHRIAVVFRDLGTYGRIVEDIFGRYRIPYLIKRGEPLRSNPLIRFLLGIFDLVSSRYKRDEIRRIVCSSYSGILREGEKPETGGRFPDGLEFPEFWVDSILRQAGITYGAWEEWEKCFIRFSKHCRPQDSERVVALMNRLGDLFAHLEKSSRPKNMDKFLTWYYQAVQKLKISKRGIVNQGNPFFYRDAQALRIFMDVLESCRESLRRYPDLNLKVEFPEFQKIVYRMVENLNIPQRQFSGEDRVQILKVNDLLGLEFPVVFACGLHEGEFPQFLQIHSILHEAEREQFNRIHRETILKNAPHKHKGRLVFQNFSEKWDEESLLFYLTLVSATNKIYFSYCSTDLNGRELLRSQFVEDVLSVLDPGHRLFDSGSIHSQTPYLSLYKSFNECLDPFEFRAKLAMERIRTHPMKPGLAESILRFLEKDPDQKRVLDKVIRNTRMEQGRESFFLEKEIPLREELGNRFSGKISSSGSMKNLNHLLDRFRISGWSPTSLERYSNCPFQFFAGDLLKIEPIEPPQTEFEIKDEGSLMHEILEAYFEERIRTGRFPMPDLEQEKRRITEISHRVFSEWHKKQHVGEENLWNSLQRQIVFKMHRALDCERLIEERGFIPVAIEAEFRSGDRTDKKSGSSQFVLTDAHGLKIPLRGKIDRLDVHPERKIVRVIDYKRMGSKSAKNRYKPLLDPVNMGTVHFQIPIYMMVAKQIAIENNFLDRVKEVDGGFFLLGRKPELLSLEEEFPESIYRKPEFLSPEIGPEIQNDRPRPPALTIAELVARIDRGDFQITPRDCSRCPYPSVCRIMEISFDSEE